MGKYDSIPPGHSARGVRRKQHHSSRGGMGFFWFWVCGAIVIHHGRRPSSNSAATKSGRLRCSFSLLALYSLQCVLALHETSGKNSPKTTISFA